MYPEKLNITLAEDDQDDRMLFKRVFDEIKLNHQLRLCDDGLDLMEYLANAEELPHIIFLDLNMPGKSGTECLRDIKADSRYKDITIAIYSSMNSQPIVEETMILGANIYIKKPDDFDALKKVLSDIIYINWQYITDGLNKENFMINC